MASNSDEGKVFASSREGKEIHTGPNMCTLCDDPAIAYCKTCQKHLCHDCKAGHRKQKKTRDHDLSDITNEGSTSGRVSCLYHSENDIKHFCDTCKTVCCGACITEKHTGHQYQDVYGYEQQIKDLCLDKAKHLREPFDWITAKQGHIKTSKDKRTQSYDAIKLELQERKRLLIEQITKIADEEITSLSNTKSDVARQLGEAGDEICVTIKRCEQVLAPVMSVVMGTDASHVFRCLQQLEVESEHISRVKENVKRLDGIPVAKAVKVGDNIKVISDIVKVLFRVDLIECKTNQASKAANEMTRLPEISQLLLSHKTQLSGYTGSSKHVHNNRMICEYGGQISILEYIDTCKVVHPNIARFTKSKSGSGECILIVDNSRYIVVSDEAISLCNDQKILISKKHQPGGYIPDIITYVSKGIFMSLSREQKEIRYHSAETLQVISSHMLSLENDAEVYTRFLFYTDDDFIVLKGKFKGSETLYKFYHDGSFHSVISLPNQFFNCSLVTICMPRTNQILAAKNDGSIHRFTLNGDHKEVGKIDNDVKYVWGSAVDKDFMYITYTLRQGQKRDWICKLRLE